MERRLNETMVYRLVAWLLYWLLYCQMYYLDF